MGTPRHLILWRILLPGALLSIFTGVRIALGFCFVLTISAEMIAAKTRHRQADLPLRRERRLCAHVRRAAGGRDRRLCRRPRAAGCDAPPPALARFRFTRRTPMAERADASASIARRRCGRRLLYSLSAAARARRCGKRWRGRPGPAAVPAERHHACCEQFWVLLFEGEIVVPLLVSLYRAFAGLALAVVFGVLWPAS